MKPLRLLTVCATAPDGSMPFLDTFKRALATPGVPARTGYWLGKIHKACTEAAADFEAARNKRVLEIGETLESGAKQVPADKRAAFQSEILAMDHELDLGVPAELRLALPALFTPEDWLPLLALELFEEPK